MGRWGNPVERETRRRIHVCVWAYAYEFHSDSLVDDATFDRVARDIDLTIETTRPGMDQWFRNNFNPSTGQWVHRHPDKAGLEILYQRIVQSRDIYSANIGRLF